MLNTNYKQTVFSFQYKVSCLIYPVHELNGLWKDLFTFLFRYLTTNKYLFMPSKKDFQYLSSTNKSDKKNW